jgi:membrane-associated protease RseP (regulator of RpoE activity)
VRRAAVIVVLCVAALLAVAYRSCDRSDRAAPQVRAPVTASKVKRVDPAKLASIAGTVIDETKRPIAGAFVCVVRDADRTCARSSADGRYALAKVEPGTLVLVASAKPYRPATLEVVLGDAETKDGVTIELRPGGVEITGAVSDVNGGPIANARVRTQSATTETAADGTFALWVAPGQMWISAEAEGYASQGDGVHAPGRIELVLFPAGTISGTVVDAATGEPVAGARIVAPEWPGGARPAAIADERGAFLLDKLLPDRYQLEARSEHGYGTARSSVVVGMGASVEGVMIRLHPAVTVTARVTVSTTEQPCAAPRVSLEDREKDRQVQLERSGTTLVAQGVLPGTYQVDLRCDGFEDGEYEPLVVGSSDVDVEWEVDPGAQITGTIRDEAGQPVDGARVSGSVLGLPAGRWRYSDAETGADGRYKLDGFPAGKVRVRVNIQTGNELEPDLDEPVTVAERAIVTRDFVVKRAGVVRGTVVDGSGRGVPGAFVMLLRGPDEEFGRYGTHCDADGTFTLARIPPGDYVASTSRAPKYQSPDARVRVSVRAGETETVKLVLAEPTGTIRGTVRDARGRAIGDAFVEAVSERFPASERPEYFHRDDYIENRPVVTNADGAFAIEALPVGTYTIRAWRRGGSSGITEHVSTGTTTTVQFKPRGSIAGIVQSGSTNLDEMSIEVRDGERFTRRERVFRTGGAFRVDNLPPGRLTISVGAAGREAHVAVELAEGEHKTGVTIELAPLVTLTGRAVDHHTGKPVQKLSVYVTPLVGRSTRFSMTDIQATTGTTDANGRFTVKRAPAGKVVLRMYGADTHAGETTIIRSITGIDTVDLGDIEVIDNRPIGRVPHGEAGLDLGDASDAGVPVTAVTPASAAALAGIRPGDLVVGVDGFDARGIAATNLYNALLAPAGTKLAITLARGITIEVELLSRR